MLTEREKQNKYYNNNLYAEENINGDQQRKKLLSLNLKIIHVMNDGNEMTWIWFGTI